MLLIDTPITIDVHGKSVTMTPREAESSFFEPILREYHRRRDLLRWRDRDSELPEEGQWIEIMLRGSLSTSIQNFSNLGDRWFWLWRPVAVPGKEVK